MNGAVYGCTPFLTFEYDNKMEQTVPFYRVFFEQITEIVSLCFNSNIRWLDVGCGTGRMADEAFKKVDSKIESFTFFDSSEDMIGIVKSKFGNNPKTEFKCKSVLELDCSDRFDIVTAVMVNHYFQDKDKYIAVKNCYSSLVPGGMMFVFENFRPNDAALEKVYLNRWKYFQVKSGKSEDEAYSHIGRYNKEYFPVTIEEHLHLYREVGFKSTELIWLSNMQAGFICIK